MEYQKPYKNLPNVINEDYESYFMQQRMRYLLSEDWQRVEANFKKELKLHIIPNDLDNLVSYLREQRESCLRTFKSKGLVASLWDKSFDRQCSRFDEIGFIRKLHIVSDGYIDLQDLNDFFSYYCLNAMIEAIMQEVLKHKKRELSGNLNVFINNGDVTFGSSDSDEEPLSENEEDEEVVKNFIFKTKIFDTNARLSALRKIVAHAIDMSEYNELFGEPNPYTIDPCSQNEWYYIMRALEEAEIITRMTVPKFIDQMMEWYPWLFKFDSPDEMVAFKRNLAKSISHEKGLWKYGKAQEVTKLKDMWARCKRLGIDSTKVERMYNAVYMGLLLKLIKLKQEIEKQQTGQ